jgi:hypothetical protein
VKNNRILKAYWKFSDYFTHGYLLSFALLFFALAAYLIANKELPQILTANQLLGLVLLIFISTMLLPFYSKVSDEIKKKSLVHAQRDNTEATSK